MQASLSCERFEMHAFQLNVSSVAFAGFSDSNLYLIDLLVFNFTKLLSSGQRPTHAISRLVN